MTTITGNTFKNATIHLDNTMYRRCTIEHCQIVYSGGELGGLAECAISHSTFMLGGASLNTLKYMASLYAVPDMRQIVEDWLEMVRRGGPPPTATRSTH